MTFYPSIPRGTVWEDIMSDPIFALDSLALPQQGIYLQENEA
jgi:hypothetical protein